MKFPLSTFLVLLACLGFTAQLRAQPVTYLRYSQVPDLHDYLLSQDNTWKNAQFLTSTTQLWGRASRDDPWILLVQQFAADIKLGAGSEVAWAPDSYTRPGPLLYITGARNSIYTFNTASLFLSESLFARGPQPGTGLAAASDQPLMLLSADALWAIDRSTGLGNALVASGTGSMPGQLSGATRISYGPDGLLYVLDRGNHRVQAFDVNDHGSLQRSFDLVPNSTSGEGMSEWLFDGTIAISPFGHIYLGDGLGGGTTYDLTGNYLGAFHPGAVNPDYDYGKGAENFLIVGSAGELSVFSAETGMHEYVDSLDSGPLADYTRIINLGAGTLTVGAGDHSTSHDGVITGTGGLTKIGTGTHTLSGTNNYMGATTVTAGTLLVNGSIAASTLTSVETGATLGGSGTIGALALGPGATLTPGNSPGTLTAGDTTFAPGSRFTFEINNATGIAGGDWDLLAIDGSLSFTATLDDPIILELTSLTLANFAGATANFDSSSNYAFTFVTTTAGVLGFDTDLFLIDTSGFTNFFSGTWSIGLTQDGRDLTLAYSGSAIPEPSTCAALFGAGALAFAAWRRRSLRAVERKNSAP